MELSIRRSQLAFAVATIVALLSCTLSADPPKAPKKARPIAFPRLSSPRIAVVSKTTLQLSNDWNERAKSTIHEANLTSSSLSPPFVIGMIDGIARYTPVSELAELTDPVNGKPVFPDWTAPLNAIRFEPQWDERHSPISEISVCRMNGTSRDIGGVTINSDNSLTYPNGRFLSTGFITTKPDELRFLEIKTHAVRGKFGVFFSNKEQRYNIHVIEARKHVPGLANKAPRIAIIHTTDGSSQGVFDAEPGRMGQHVLLVHIAKDGTVMYRTDNQTSDQRRAYFSLPANSPVEENDGDILICCAPGYFIKIELEDGTYNWDPRLLAYVHDKSSMLPIGSGHVTELTDSELQYLDGVIEKLCGQLKWKREDSIQRSLSYVEHLITASLVRQNVERTNWENLNSLEKLALLRRIAASAYREGGVFGFGKKISHENEPAAVIRCCRVVESEAIQIHTCAHPFTGALTRLEYLGYSDQRRGYSLKYLLVWETSQSTWLSGFSKNGSKSFAKTAIVIECDKEGVPTACEVVKDESTFEAFGAADNVRDYVRKKVTEAVSSNDSEKKVAEVVFDVSLGRDTKEGLLQYLRRRQVVRESENEFRPWSWMMGFQVKDYYRR
ncbi:MAG: hypothetical protein AABP62_05315 [Planctomycetota bacterium]